MNTEATYNPVRDDLPAERKQEYWQTAFGLQAVDGLKPSQYITQLVDEHIRGTKTYAQVYQETENYYRHATQGDPAEEADKVSTAIYEILADESFRFDIPTFKSYHRRLFQGLDPKIFHPGEFRTINITKKEPVLNGDTVQYQDFSMLEETLQFDFEEEKSQDYLKMTDAEKVARFAEFTSRIWQVHPFREGNTRTTAVFIEKYLRHLGYVVDNELFEHHSLYFRNALVLANYDNIPQGVKSDSTYLQKFFDNLLFSAGHKLRNF